MNNRSSFSKEDLLACGRGEMFGEGNAQLPGGDMLMVDRISHISSEGGDFNKGEIIANSPQFEKYTINENVTLYSGVTPFSKYGNKFLMILCSLILLFSYIFDQWKYKKIIK